MEENVTKKEKKFIRRPVRNFPRHPLEAVLVIAKGIQNKNAGKPMKRLLVADVIGRKPTSPGFRDLLSSSFKYGLTLGTEKADNISLTELGQNITKPTSPEMQIESKQKAIMHPEILKKIYSHFKDHQFKRDSFFENQLETQFEVPREYVKEVAAILEKNAKYAGVLKDISGSPHIIFGDFSSIETENDLKETKDGEMGERDIEETRELKNLGQEEINKPKKKQPIFIAHGKNKIPLDQLKKILDKFKIPYKIAVDEPNAGRPIPKKVRDLMNECSSAIFIFSKKDENVNEEGTIIPNSNVVFELGAASVLYGEKLIIFKEKGIKFPSDFNSLGYTEFEEDNLEAKSMDLMGELISMGFVKVITA